MLKNMEELCLSIQQAKELQKLGLKLYKNTSMVFCDFNDQVHEYELMDNHDDVEIGAFDVVPTLSINEMIEMLPRTIKCEKKVYTLAIYPCVIDYLICYEFYDYDGEREDKIDIRGHSFKGVLFNSLKFLLKEKII